MLSPFECGRETCFTWVDYDDGEVLCFAVDRIEKQIQSDYRQPGISAHLIDVEPGLVKHLWKKHGLEPHRLARLMPEQVDHWPPILIAEHKDRHIMIDGGHRMVRAYQFGVEQIPGWLISADVWRPYLIDLSQIENDPRELRENMSYYHQSGFSGIA